MKQSLLLASIWLLVFSGCVGQDKYVLLENRVASLEMENNRQLSEQQSFSQREAGLKEEMARIKEELDQKTGGIQERYAEINYELKQAKEKFQQMDTRIQELSFNLGTNSAKRREDLEKELERLDGAISRNYERLIKLERYMGFEPMAGKGDDPDSSGVISEPSEEMSETRLYDFAKTLFDKGDMENARIQFENFINKFPDSKNADNARFWIADSYYAEKWYEKAILEYQKVLEDYPDSNKTAAARLKQGYSFAELGEKANARLILNELVKRHPKAKEASYAREKLKSLN
ncbi:tol-pal system protein YbgF [Desulfospira joergensenii]|uniref:tol-pal system protein YbgF n=1 Tax=Desulfospira joergensenii TaxID=53329 RepID=UPI0003B462CD|nr:tol-pal system protein YbgF [Desulfospira joergensenii]